MISRIRAGSSPAFQKVCSALSSILGDEQGVASFSDFGKGN
jgi:hypothetical protein